MSEQMALIDEEVPTEEVVEKVVTEEVSEESTEHADDEQAAEEVVIVTIGDAEPEASNDENSSVIKEFRKREREKDKLIRELQARVAAPEARITEVGPEPDLTDEDVDYDKDKFKAKWNSWNARKQKADAEKARLVDEQNKEQAAWQGKLNALATSRESLKVPDYADAESVVQDVLSEKQQAIVVRGSKNPAVLFYALGKNPGKAKELAGITDLVEYTWAAAQLETQLKQTTRKSAPPSPESKVAGTGSKSGTFDSHLQKLEEEADRTGDRTKVAAYRREQKLKAA